MVRISPGWNCLQPLDTLKKLIVYDNELSWGYSNSCPPQLTTAVIFNCTFGSNADFSGANKDLTIHVEIFNNTC